MKIGKITINSKLALAPMAGVTDLGFRTVCRELGAGYTVTEMVSAKALCYQDKKSLPLLELGEGEHPAAVQLFGSDPYCMEQAAGIAAEKSGADILDINMGCPVKKVVSSGDGSALMKTPDLAARVAEAAVKAVSVPVTVKMRLGWDDTSKNVLDFAKRIESVGVAAVAVHGRTREQMYMGHADWSYIKEVKEALQIPVMGNGDVVDALSAKALLDETGCDAVLIGRGAQGNPWIFNEVNQYLANGTLLPKPTAHERLNMLLRHFELLCKYKGTALGVREIRTHAGWYIKGLPESAKWRNRINTLYTEAAFKEAIATYAAELTRQ